jgi:hypothetical protein
LCRLLQLRRERLPGRSLILLAADVGGSQPAGDN